MASERRPPGREIEFESEEATVTPIQFVVVEQEGGAPRLDLVEGEYEQRYRVGDEYAATLFVAVCRKHRARAYRRARLHQGTLCVKTSMTKHDALWAQFLAQSRRLNARLFEVTELFVHDEVEPPER